MKPSELLRTNLKTVIASLMHKDFQRFWAYKSASAAGRFLDGWRQRAKRSKIEPIKKMARTLRKHHELLCNGFLTEGGIFLGTVEGLYD